MKPLFKNIPEVSKPKKDLDGRRARHIDCNWDNNSMDDFFQVLTK